MSTLFLKKSYFFLFFFLHTIYSIYFYNFILYIVYQKVFILLNFTDIYNFLVSSFNFFCVLSISFFVCQFICLFISWDFLIDILIYFIYFIRFIYIICFIYFIYFIYTILFIYICRLSFVFLRSVFLYIRKKL